MSGPLTDLMALLGPATAADLLTIAERDEANRRAAARGETSGRGALVEHTIDRSTLQRWEAEDPPAHISRHAGRLMRELDWLKSELPEGIGIHAVLHVPFTRQKSPYEYLRVGSWEGFKTAVGKWLKRRRGA